MQVFDRITKKNWGIFKKILYSFLFFSILPLIVFALITAFLFNGSNEKILNDTRLLIDKNIEKNLMIQAKQISRKAEHFLRNREFDLLELSKLELSESTLLNFSQSKTSQIWIKANDPNDSLGIWKFIPLYKEIEFADNLGNQIVKIINGKPIPNWQKRNISNPINTTYFSENYFELSKKLNQGEIYTSHLTGFFVSQEELRIDPTIQYNGIIRFVTPVYKNGERVGILSLGLDHQHLMEFTQHVLPNSTEEILYPNYNSGDYAFLFDDEGWIITHPKIWDIRGLDGTGKLFPAFNANSTEDDIRRGFIPFNLDSSAFIHPNYPIVYKNVINKLSGKVTTKNVGGTQKIMVYAPIFYDKGVYSKNGVFGGTTLGIETKKFLSSSFEIKYLISNTFEQYFNNILYVIFGSIFFSLIVSFFFSRNFTKPIIKLTKFSSNLADGKLNERIHFNRKDEIGSLARSFNRMANELEKGRNQLLNSNAELASSRTNMENYALDLEYQLNVLKSIQSISNTIGFTYHLDTVLKKILNTSVKNLHFNSAVLYLVDEENKIIECKEICSYEQEEILVAKKLKHSLGKTNSIETEVIKYGKIVFIQNYEQFKKEEHKTLLTTFFENSSSFVFIPLIVQEKIIGILGADKINNTENISENDINSLQILANQASRAIENSKLYSEIISQRNFVNDIISNMMNGVISTNGNGIITSINKAARQILELPELDDLLGQNLWVLLSQKDDFRKDIFNSLNNTGIYRAYEIELKLRNKKKFLNITVSRVYRNNIHYSSILIVEDVTEKKIMDEEFKKIDRLASLGRFAAGIAHEIRNPLTGLSLFLDNLHDHISIIDPANSNLISNALNEIERLDNLVNEILDYSFPSKSKMQNANINAIINGILLLLNQQILKSNIIVDKCFEDSIPNFSFDTEKIKQALLNIILNSIQFMPTGGSLIIETKFLQDENTKNSVLIKIADTGKGFEENEIENIFDPFYSGRQEGTGLGLAITHSIISDHKGTIIANNSKNHGAEFKITIPIEREL
ncbi:MAG: hypothetical protein COW71_03520 [Ignavibacteriales bacterium CG18_big_fil_WC_8_21_14_2_50_31_20]|nr:MAG: hypothetical protein COW71_03520 [Ignavibacteriales bacterium CG18_big_fil_WC_8_21_14_2_50_31_20]